MCVILTKLFVSLELEVYKSSKRYFVKLCVESRIFISFSFQYDITRFRSLFIAFWFSKRLAGLHCQYDCVSGDFVSKKCVFDEYFTKPNPEDEFLLMN